MGNDSTTVDQIINGATGQSPFEFLATIDLFANRLQTLVHPLQLQAFDVQKLVR